MSLFYHHSDLLVPFPVHRCLDRATLARAVCPLLSPSEIDAVMRRRDTVLEYLDNLVAQHGYDKVVIEAAPQASMDASS